MDPQNPKDPIDPASLLLPKKDAPPPAERINAGALLEQEVQAASPKPERPEVSPLQTYKGDVEKSIEDRGVSVVSVAAAEAARRGKLGATSEAKKEAQKKFNMSLLMVLGGVALIVAALGVATAIFLRPTTATGPRFPVPPSISADETALVLADTSSRDTLMTAIAGAVQSTKLSLGLIEWLYIGLQRPGSPLTQLPAQDLIGTIAPNVPPELLRTLQPTYLLGVHSFDQNQAFLILQTDSYATTYSGMLSWERTMRGDLYPVFDRTPSPHLNPAAGQATSTEASSTTQFIQTGFVDKVVENRDTRVLLNKQGDILLLWTMLGRNIILITTNEYTLREVVARMNVAPIVPIPGR